MRRLVAWSRLEGLNNRLKKMCSGKMVMRRRRIFKLKLRRCLNFQNKLRWIRFFSAFSTSSCHSHYQDSIPKISHNFESLILYRHFPGRLRPGCRKH